MSAPICVAFPTIMDGLVLRWYADEAAYLDGNELASASRNRAMIEPAASVDVCKMADAAHDYLHREYRRALHPRLDVSRWVTHKGSFGSDELKPVAAAPSPIAQTEPTNG